MIGYSYDHGGNLDFPAFTPSFEAPISGWHTRYPSPISDMNAGGQVVGISVLDDWRGGYYAAFSTVDGKTHGFFAAESDNLNNYIPLVPGAYLDSAFKIDDDGRILAHSENGHDYLLTPIELGAPATVPEPTTLMLFGFASIAVGLRPIRRVLKF